MPGFEFLFSGTAFWGAAGFLFTSVLAVIAIQKHPAYWPAICLLPILFGGFWLATARSEAEKAKPERDYAYFTLSNDPRDTNGEATALVSIATGPLRDVNVAIQRAEERKKGSRQYIFSVTSRQSPRVVPYSHLVLPLVIIGLIQTNQRGLDRFWSIFK